MTRIRDAYAAQVMKGHTSLVFQDWQPVAVYINGRYWGYFDLRERINAEWLGRYGGVDGNNLDLIKGKDIEDYSLHDLVWKRADYNKRYFDDKIVVSGHTPTQYIEDNPKPGYVYKRNNHIAIDCGAHIKDGRLACVCLDTLEEFYSFTNEKDTY